MTRLSPLFLLGLLAACGTDVSGPGDAVLPCAFGEATNLAVGEVLPDGEGEFAPCLGPGGEDGVFVFIPFLARRPPPDGASEVVRLSLTGAGILAPPSIVTGRASADVLPRTALRSRGDEGVDWSWHLRLRQREIDELEPRIRPRAAGGLAALEGPTPAADIPAVGDRLAFNTAISCSEEEIRTGEVVYVSERAIVVADTANPGGLAPADYAYFAVTFDTLIAPVETEHFGQVSDIDENGRSILFFTRAVNELNDRGGSSMTIGFFWSGDLFPEVGTDRLEACPAANQAEMFYLIAPDPAGVVGPKIGLERLRDLAIPLIGHEYQHLTNASRRLFFNGANVFERPWLNEGLSHIAEELLFYAVSGFEPGQNIGIDQLREARFYIDAFNEYMGGNLVNFGDYLEHPDSASLMGIDDLATRGATWNFLRYAADRSGRGDSPFFYDVVNSREAGLDNLREVLGSEDPLDWMTDWSVSVFADDLVPDVHGHYRLPSWNLRTIYPATERWQNGYPLELIDLVPNETARIGIRTGGSVYARYGIAADDKAVIQVTADGDGPPSGLRGSYIRVR